MKRVIVPPICFFLAGIAGAGIRALPIVFSFSALLCVFIMMIPLIRSRCFYFMICIFFLLLGGFRQLQAMDLEGKVLREFVKNDKQRVVVLGTVFGYPEMRAAGYTIHAEFPFRLEKVLIDGKENSMDGLCMVKIFSPRDRIEVGDRLIVSGDVSVKGKRRIPVIFSKRHYYYVRAGISGNPLMMLKRGIFRLRHKASMRARRLIRGEAIMIADSVLLGLRGSMTERVRNLFAKTGTMHIMAISGLHVGIVGLLLFSLFNVLRFPRRLVYVMTILGITGFAVFAGGRASSLRAALMGSFLLAGKAMGRRGDIVTALFLSAFIITYFSPGQIFDLGFILSYTAVLSILFIEPLFADMLGASSGGRVRKFVCSSFATSFAVWIATAPIIAGCFGRVTPVVVAANLAAVPALTGLLVAGMGVLVIGAGVFSSGFELIWRVLAFILGLFTKLPFASFSVQPPNVVLMAVYYLALALTVCISVKIRKRGIIVVFLLLAANIFLWNELIMGVSR